MYGILGNRNGVVKPWYLPFDFVFCRVRNDDLRTVVWIVKNNSTRNVYNLPVEIHNGRVVRVFEKACPHGWKPASDCPICTSRANVPE